jgi:hypothetical protein
MLRKKINIELLHELLDYDQDTGVFRWKKDRFAGSSGKSLIAQAGQIAGGIRPDGYSQIGIKCVRHLSHLLAWAYVHGNQPDEDMQIDHIDGNRSNNRISNLRLVTVSQNMQNLQKAKRHNLHSGVLGVHWHGQGQCWRVRIKVNGRYHHIGLFKTIEEAQCARIAAEKAHFTHSPNNR